MAPPSSLRHHHAGNFRLYPLAAHYCPVHCLPACLQVLRGVTTAPMSVFKRLYLLLSGVAVLGFVWVHLGHFRLSDAPKVATGDLYGVLVEIMADDWNVAGCVRASACE
jgi:hypothetical protein